MTTHHHRPHQQALPGPSLFYPTIPPHPDLLFTVYFPRGATTHHVLHYLHEHDGTGLPWRTLAFSADTDDSLRLLLRLYTLPR